MDNSKYKLVKQKKERGARMNWDNVIGFMCGTALCMGLALIILHNCKPQNEAVFKEGVKEGCAMTIYCANNGMTNIPIDKIIDEAWKNRQAKK